MTLVVRKSDRNRFALKKITKEMKTLEPYVREIEGMKNCVHKNVVAYEESYFHNNTLYMVIEYCDGGTLRDLINEVEVAEIEIAYFIKQVCSGLKYLHNRRIMHRDIKVSQYYLL